MHKLRLSVEDLMAGSEGGRQRGGKTPAAGAANKRRRSPSPAGSGSAVKGGAAGTPSASAAGNKRKSVRPSALGKKFKGGEEEGDDLTRDMDDPPSDTNIREVEVPKTAATPGGLASSANVKNADWMPTKGF